MSAVRVIGTVPPLTTFDYPSASDSRRSYDDFGVLGRGV